MTVNQEHWRADAIYSCVLSENLSAKYGRLPYELLVRELLRVPEATQVLTIAPGHPS